MGRTEVIVENKEAHFLIMQLRLYITDFLCSRQVLKLKEHDLHSISYDSLVMFHGHTWVAVQFAESEIMFSMSSLQSSS